MYPIQQYEMKQSLYKLVVTVMLTNCKVVLMVLMVLMMSSRRAELDFSRLADMLGELVMSSACRHS